MRNREFPKTKSRGKGWVAGGIARSDVDEGGWTWDGNKVKLCV